MLELEVKVGDLRVPERLLLGPGPNGIEPRVLQAMAMPTLGHLDPAFIEIMNETSALLRYVFQTKNELTIPVSGTGSAGMDCVLSNLIEEGDEVVVAVCGLFGERMVDIAERCGARVELARAPWGRMVEPDEVRKALSRLKRPKLIALVHAETSTGVMQPIEEISSICKEVGALLVVDCVTSLSGAPVLVDEWGVDAAYSGTQKCLSCPPGLSPVTLNERARKVIHERRSKPKSWYLDLTMVERYWGGERFYHHTAPVNMIYGLREALRIVAEEGLEQRWRRHALNAKAFIAGCEAMGLEIFAQEGYRLPSLITVKVPQGVDELSVRKYLLSEFNVEIGGGLGELKGKIWRFGFMGYNSKRKNVELALAALASALSALGRPTSASEAIAAADEVYREARA